MTIRFENQNDVIVYALEKIIEHARRTQQIFIVQCVWWLVSIIGLEQGLINYIDNLYSQIEITVTSETMRGTSAKATKDISELCQDQVLEECEEYLKESRRLRDIATLKSKGETQRGRINPTPISKRALKKRERYMRKQEIPAKKESKTVGIDEAEIQRRKEAGECLRCAWPSDRKGTHRVKSCIRPIKVTKGTAPFPKAEQYLQQPITGEASSDAISSEDSSDDSL